MIPKLDGISADISRRAFACGCGTLAMAGMLSGCAGEDAGTAAVDVSGAPAEPDAHDASSDAPPDLHYGFWFETARCIGCTSCVAACREQNGLPEDAPARRHVLLYRFRDGRERYLSYSCMHCAEPACVRVCPARAISKGEGGAVLVNKDCCIGCKYCHQACPFHVPEYLPEGMDKCDLCLGAGISLGDAPACVALCPTRALHYGTLSELSREAGTDPLDAPGSPSFIVT